MTAALLVGFVFVVPSSTETAVANGDTRTLHLVHASTHETIDATFRVNGAYDPAVLKKLNWFLRDWRRNEETNMDPRLFDVIWEVYRSAGATEPITVYSGYRSPQTNAMLRRRSRAVARHSQHMLGKAMDTTMPGMPMEKIREIAMRLQRGGVGYYQNANFVHIDVGGVRSWPRMSYDQLARLFPDGKTVHIAAGGRTLPRYEEARAEIEAGGGSAWTPPAKQSKSFFAWLFGGSKEDDDEEEAARVTTPAAHRGSRTQVAALSQPAAQAQAGQPVSADVDEGGGRNFFIEEQNRSRRGQVELAAATPPQPQPPQVQPAQVQPAPVAPTQPAAVPAAPPTHVSSAQTPDLIAAALVPTVLPPRRPADLVTAAADTPLPPIRPTLVAALDPAALSRSMFQPAQAASPDAIGTLIGRPAAPAPRLHLPVEITQGFSGHRPAADAASTVLAYAPAARISGLRSAAAQPPASRGTTVVAETQNVVSARLDRSNFASLTSTTTTRNMIGQAALAPTVASLRQSARMVAELFSHELSASGYASQFETAATDLPVSHFRGAAVQPLAQAGVMFASSGLRRD